MLFILLSLLAYCLHLSFSFISPTGHTFFGKEFVAEGIKRTAKGEPKALSVKQARGEREYKIRQ